MVKFLSVCLIIFSLAYVAIFYIFKPNFIITSKGISIVSAQIESSFFIPANSPISVYEFEPHPKQLDQIIQADITESDAKFGIYIKNLVTGQEYKLNGNEQFDSASLYKLFVMYTIFKKGQENKLDISKTDIQQNLAQMIELSSNDAAYYLVDNYTSWDEVNKDMQDLSLTDTNLVNPGLPQTTPQNVGALLDLISQGKAVDNDSSEQMINFMANQQKRDRIPALLPSDIFVVNKTGELNDVRHDAAIIGTPKNDYILVLMSKNSANPEEVKPVMAKMSLDIYNFFENEWKNPPEIL